MTKFLRDEPQTTTNDIDSFLCIEKYAPHDLQKQKKDYLRT